MQPKFRTAMVLFLTLLLFTTACRTDNATNSEIVLPILQTPKPGIPPTASEICTNILHPTTQGATWAYTSTGGPGGSFNYIKLYY